LATKVCAETQCGVKQKINRVNKKRIRVTRKICLVQYTKIAIETG
jgi:hypothetical protein